MLIYGFVYLLHSSKPLGSLPYSSRGVAAPQCSYLGFPTQPPRWWAGTPLADPSLALTKDSVDQKLIWQWDEVRAHFSACGLGTGLALYGYAAVLAAGAITLATGVLRKEALRALPSQKGERGLGTAWPHLQAALIPQKHLRWFREGCRMWVDTIQSCRPWGRWWTREESFHLSTDFSLGLGQMEGGNALGKVTSLFDSDDQ